MGKETGLRFKCVVVGCVVFLLTLGGCTATNPFGSSSGAEMASADMDTFSNKVMQFDDIEIPMEMEYDKEESMAIRTDSFEGGVLHYRGRVELQSLKQFLISTMEAKKWKLVGEAQTKKTLLTFTKPNKTCMVVLEEGLGGKYGYTTAKFYVTVDLAAAGMLNPFGEPVMK